MNNDNIWYYGVVDTSILDDQPPCLLAKTTMKAWHTTDPAKDALLQKISCGSGKTGADCWNTADYLQIFGPSPDGNVFPAKLVKPDGNGNCIWTNRGGDQVNIGPVEPKSSKYPGQCIHNIFYCNGNGICENEQCKCASGYAPDQDENNCIKKDAPSTNFKCVFGSGMASGKCGFTSDGKPDPSDWNNDNNNCGPKNNTGWCDIKHFCKDGLTAKQATQMCTYNNGSNQKTGCKSTNDGGTQGSLGGCNFGLDTTGEPICCYVQGNVEGCQNESGTCTTDADCGPIGNCVNPSGEPNSGKCPAGTYAGKDKDGNAFTLYYTGQWNDHIFETTCSYSPYPEQKSALGPS